MRELRERGKKGKGSHCFPLVLFKDRKEIRNMGCDKACEWTRSREIFRNRIFFVDITKALMAKPS